MSGSSIPGRLPATSLIICARNRPQLLFEAVESVLQGDEVPAELVIVDQSDVPNAALATLKTVRGCEIRYLWTHTVGLSRANNTGIAAASHDILVFTHDDVCVTPAWFGALVRSLIEAGPRSVVTGQVRLLRERPDGFQLTIKVDEVPAVYEGRIGKDELYPLNMGMYRSAVDEVAGFDVRLGPGTSFPAAEDNDLGFRLLEAGYRIIYVPQAALYHRAWRSGLDYLPLRWVYGRGEGAFYAKHLSLRDRYMLRRMRSEIVHHVRMFTGRWRRHPRQACGDVIYMLGVLLGVARTRHLPSFASRWWHRPRAGCGDLVYVLGILTGASQWLLTQRGGRAWPENRSIDSTACEMP